MKVKHITPKYVLVLDWFTKQDDPKTHGFSYRDLDASTLLEAITEAEDRIDDEAIAADLYLVKICEYQPNMKQVNPQTKTEKLYKAVLCCRDISRGYAHWHVCDLKHAEEPDWYISRNVYGSVVYHDCIYTDNVYNKKLVA